MNTILEFTIRVCPVCGRTDRFNPLKDRHFSQGRMCDGKPVALLAVAKYPAEWDPKGSK